MPVPPHRRVALSILPPDLVAAVRAPLPNEGRRDLIRRVVATRLVQIQALRYAEELSLAHGVVDDAGGTTGGTDGAGTSR